MSAFGWLGRGGRFRWDRPIPGAQDALAAVRPPAPGAGPATPPRSSPPAPGQDGIYGREVMTTHFYDTGITVTDDLVRGRQLVDVPPADEWGCLGCGRPDGVWCEPGCLDGGKDTET